MPAFLYILSLLLLPAAAVAQGGEVFPQERLRELREEIRYVPPPPEPEEPPAFEMPTLDLSAFRNPLIIGLGLLLAAGLGLLLYRLLREGSAPRRAAPAPPSPVDISRIEEERAVHEGVPADLIAAAEAAGQYTDAVRLRYLNLLGDLRRAGLIRWRRDYSNRDYQRQLAGHALAPAFRTATATYERYWFGRYPIDRLAYRAAGQQLDAVAVPSISAP